MSGITTRAGNGAMLTISQESTDALGAAMDGDLLMTRSPGYDTARAIWNAMIDRHPALIARCLSAADVVAAVRFAREHQLLVAVRGGGHNIAGTAICDDGLVIDLSAMKSVAVDADARTARVEPGCTLADFDAEAQKAGLATPVGINSTTGIAGLTLGGGFGWLSRRHGMTVDNLLSVDIVTADGELRRASADENADLFWAVRGGGGNFGIVTSFEFRLHPVGPEVLAGLIVHPFEDAANVLRQYRAFADEAPDDVTAWVVMRHAPPLPFLPEEWHGRRVIVIAAFHDGDRAEGERLLAPLRAIGNPIADVIGPSPYAGWQQAFDPLLTPGARNYWKSHDFLTLSDDLLDTLEESVRGLPGPECEIFIAQAGGAASRIPADATAYPHRDHSYTMNVHTRWQDAADDDAFIGWARGVFESTAPFATGGVYVNFMPTDETGRIAAAYGDNYDRLVEIKATWDPDNLFRSNQNIRPLASA